MTTTLKTYPKYKASKIEWVDSIPNDWDVKPLRYCCSENIKKNTALSNTTILSLSYGNVILKDTDKNFGLVPESYSAYQILEPGDIVMRLTDLQNDHVSLRTGLVKNKGIITSAYLGLKIYNDKIDNSYFHWLLHSYDLQKVFYGMGGGIRQTVGFDDLKWLPIIIPNIETQKNIADFLDKKTRIIDEIVAKKEKIIELLREKRTALITRAVTKGLDPKAKMKTSGIDWLGDIPEECGLFKLRHLGKFTASGIDKIIKESENPVRIINYTDVYKAQKFILKNKEYMVVTATPEKIKQHQVDIGDLIFTPSSEVIEEIGLSALVDEKMENTAFSYHVLRFQFDNHIKISHNFKKYLANNFFTLTQFSSRATGSIRKTLSRNDFKEVEVLVPKIEMQEKIALFLDKQIDIADNIVSHIESQIDQLKEYRSSLIYSTVTGKIKV